MTDIPLRELRNHTSEILHRVEDGEQLTITVNGRRVAQLVPLPRRKPYLTAQEILGRQADPDLKNDLNELLGNDELEDIEAPWKGQK